MNKMKYKKNKLFRITPVQTWSRKGRKSRCRAENQPAGPQQPIPTPPVIKQSSAEWLWPPISGEGLEGWGVLFASASFCLPHPLGCYERFGEEEQQMAAGGLPSQQVFFFFYNPSRLILSSCSSVCFCGAPPPTLSHINFCNSLQD